MRNMLGSGKKYGRRCLRTIRLYSIVLDTDGDEERKRKEERLRYEVFRLRACACA